MKIAFFLDNRHIPSIDFSAPELGNPGTGACEYLHVAIPYFLKKYTGHDIDPVILAPHIANLPKTLSTYTATSVLDAATKAKEIGVDFFVFRPRLHEEEDILDHIDRLALPSIGRAALTPVPQHVRKMANSKYFKALVCVGREQYDSLIDTPLHSKLAYIDNGIHVDSCQPNQKSVNKDPSLVVYMGALVPMKGFHLLAQAWPKVLQKCPHAKLSVIGSVKMYGDQLSVGPLGVAADAYERDHIIPYLCDDQGRLHPSVTFHGQMGQDKFAIIQRASVGIANPSGQTETCCVSAVEISACKTPVVSGAYYALLDTVLHNQTGLLGRGIDQLANHICSLLQNPEQVHQFGQAGYHRARNQYDFSVTIPKWHDLFMALKGHHIPKPPGHLKNVLYHYKILRIVNSIPQKILGRYIPWPSLFEAQEWIKKIFLRSKNT